MELFRNRPFCVFCLCGIGTLGLLTLLPGWGKIILAALAVLLTLLCVLFLFLNRKSQRKKEEREKKLFFAFFCFLFALLFSLSYFAFDVLPSFLAEKKCGEERRIVLSVVEPVSSNGKSVTYEARFRSVDGEKYRAKTVLTVPFGAELRPGDTVVFIGEITPSGSRPFAPAETARGALTECYADSENSFAVAGNEATFASTVRTLRRRICLLFDKAYGEDGGLLRALLLGDTSGLSARTRSSFRRAGVSHLLAVSGLHVSALVGLCNLLLRKLRTPKKARLCVLSLFAVILLFLNGFSPSACRAVLMLLFSFAGFLLTRETDTVSALFGAVTLILFFSPDDVGSPALWLSSLATLGLLTVFSEQIDGRLRLLSQRESAGKGKRRAVLRSFRLLLRRIASRAGLSLCCVFFTAFLLSVVFGELSLAGIPSGLILAPLCLTALTAGTLLLPLSLFSGVFSLPVSWLCFLIGKVCDFFADLPGASLPVGSVFPRVVLGVMTLGLAVFLVVRLPKEKRPFVFVLPAAAAVLLAGFFVFRTVFPGPLTVTPFSSASGDLFVLRRGNATALVDASAGNAGLRYAASEEIRSSGGGEIDLIVLTASRAKTADMISAFRERMPVRRVAVPSPVTEEERTYFLALLTVCEREKIALTVYDRDLSGEVLSAGGLTLYTEPEKAGSSLSVRVLVTDGKTDFCVENHP